MGHNTTKKCRKCYNNFSAALKHAHTHIHIEIKRREKGCVEDMTHGAISNQGQAYGCAVGAIIIHNCTYGSAQITTAPSTANFLIGALAFCAAL
jgi:hypothetical protein